MKDLLFILKEHKTNFYKIYKLALYDFITPLRDTYRIVGTVLRFMFYLTPILWTSFK